MPCALGAAGIAIVAVGFAAAGYVQHARHVAEAELTASRVEAANVDLQEELARLRDKVATNSRDLAAAQSRVAALVDEERARAHHEALHAAATGRRTERSGS